MKKDLMFLLCGTLAAGSALADNYVISTPNTSLVITANKKQKAYIQYYGSRISKDDINSLFDSRSVMWQDTYPTFGLHSSGEKALYVTHSDGTMSTDLCVQEVRQYKESNADLTEITLNDTVYPFTVKQYFKAYNGTDVISTWTEIINSGRKPVTLYKYVSGVIPVPRAENWMTHFNGGWGSEEQINEEYIGNNMKVIRNTDGVRNAHTSNPSLMITLNGKPQENTGSVIGATLAWSGNFKLKTSAGPNYLTLFAGIDEENAHYILDGGKSLVTPELILTYSNDGKGGVSRAIHKWARKYGVHNGEKPRDILLNSWEGVYFKVNQKGMAQMMEDIASLGGELFVMDDGWFGNKYPRNNGSTSLGDWEVCREKLPEGIDGLTAAAKKNHIKFGIWIEPEMSDVQSELYEKHPDWVLSQKNRQLITGRGNSQVILDLSNPAVQDFVYGAVDRLMTNNPEIAYIKWDANAGIMNYGSPYLPKNKQSHIYVEYHKGLTKTLQRIREKYPDLVIQACGAGGGRASYGVLPYYDEFWTSDNTDALQRIYIQWGTSMFYPAITMAAHVSANRNHQTGRTVPLKYRFDVAMSGRLGMEIQLRDMSDSDKEYARRAISAYKEVRDVVQLGDLYRLVSPYDNKGMASLMYTTENKDRAVVFVYKMTHFSGQSFARLHLDGVDVSKKYRIKDLTPRDPKRPASFDGKVISGAVLKAAGLDINSALNGEYASLALELTEVK